MKDELLALYEKHHASLKAVRAAHPAEDMAGPFLISPNAIYPLQPHRLMIIGQETGGWEYNVDDLRAQMEAYEEFNVGETYRSSPFWNVTRKVEQALGNEPFSCAWSNISKFDHNNTRASGKYAASIASVDHLLREEIAIIKPTVCLFYTGPEFDTRVCAIFPGVAFHEVPGHDERELARLEHPGLPHHSYRAYHPKYMRLRGLEEGFIEFIEHTVR